MEERPRIFISHHHKDKKLAEALSNMIKNISAGALETFFSSSRDTKEGIRFGAEWFKKILTEASVSKACICLLTPNSLKRPWILFEAGLAKGNGNCDVYCITFQVPSEDITTTPFQQLQNLNGNDAEKLEKMIREIAAYQKAISPQDDQIQQEINKFREQVSEIVEEIQPESEELENDQNSLQKADLSKLLHEMNWMFRQMKNDPNNSGENFSLELKDMTSTLKSLNEDVNSKFLNVDFSKLTEEPQHFPNHDIAQKKMSSVLLDVAEKRDSLKIHVLGVSLRFSWPFLKQKIEELTRKFPNLIFDIEFAMVKCSYLEEQNVKDWANRASQTYKELLQFKKEYVSNNKDNFSSFKIYKYESLPQWHGLLIDEEKLFLGRANWTFNEANPDNYQFSVGQNKYRFFQDHDRFGGSERIALFENWFQYIKIVSEKLEGSDPN